ncbi:hypothetical protein ABBQ38_010549 [Trebouxia sp. C0009 RCD-2024]
MLIPTSEDPPSDYWLMCSVSQLIRTASPAASPAAHKGSPGKSSRVTDTGVQPGSI